MNQERLICEQDQSSSMILTKLEQKNQFQGVHDSLHGGRLLVLQGFQGSPLIPVMTYSVGNDAMNDVMRLSGLFG